MSFDFVVRFQLVVFRTLLDQVRATITAMSSFGFTEQPFHIFHKFQIALLCLICFVILMQKQVEFKMPDGRWLPLGQLRNDQIRQEMMRQNRAVWAWLLGDTWYCFNLGVD